MWLKEVLIIKLRKYKIWLRNLFIFMKYTLGKEEKLKGVKQIELLFKHGKRIKLFPIQLIYLPVEQTADFPIKVGFSVPKRNIKLAVNRNKIKRLMREAYRKNKHLYSKHVASNYVFMFIYMGKEKENFEKLQLVIQNIAKQFSQQIS